MAKPVPQADEFSRLKVAIKNRELERLYFFHGEEVFLLDHYLNEMKKIVSSDAHYLWDINERENFFTLEDEPYSSDLVRKRLFEYLRK